MRQVRRTTEVDVVLAEQLVALVDERPELRFEAYDGSAAGPPDAKVTVRVRTPEAIARLATRPGELGIVRAYVAGDLDLDGDLDELFRVLGAHRLRLHLAALPGVLAAAGRALLHPPPPPPEEAQLAGRLHSRSRDRRAVSHHYDVSNDFYRLVLGPTMTYSCAVFADPQASLDEAQAAKYDLICRKLALRPGMRLLDVGCGWGGMALHAATHYGCEVVGVTVARQQHDLARARVAQAGLADRVDIRLQDYRDIDDGPFDAISSIGMFEHVGRRMMATYFGRLHELLVPRGRLVNHAIGRPGYPTAPTTAGRALATGRRLLTAAGSTVTSRIDSPFMQRYVFPDGELHEIGIVVSMMQEAGFEVRHLETLREHYARTLRAWVANLEARWDEAVRLVGVGRARVWRLYMTASAVGFERGALQVHQTLAVRPAAGDSGLGLAVGYQGIDARQS